MAAGNTTDRFGWVSRTLHWTMALGVLVMLPLGTLIEDMEVGYSNLWLFGLHKTIGVVLLALLVMRVVWHLVSPPPSPLPSGTGWKDVAAVWVHRAFYALLVIVPLSGWIGSGATGIDVVVFNSVTLPPLAPASEAWEEAAFEVHEVATKILLLCVVLHIAGALTRRDGTLGRMISGRQVSPRL